ncbi:MAG: PQQ-dependent sugar dehydrogenase [Phycisphaerae bacterium]|nr:PQQ-dependent sugar dehydrogenase [Phycisphaerae bacterium]
MRHVLFFFALSVTVGCTDIARLPDVTNNSSSPVEVPPEATVPVIVQPSAPIHELHGQRFRVETVASGLSGPWALAWLGDGRLIFTQRGGELSIVEAGVVRRLHHFAEVQPPAGSDGGLMGLAVSPTFSRDGLIYVSYTGVVGNEPRNIIARYRLSPDATPAVTPGIVLLSALPAAETHNGLPLRFGPDGMLWAFTGDAGLPGPLPRSQLAGKLLRMNPDGTVPKDNPFPYSLVWSSGHRNCLAFDWYPDEKVLYAMEQRTDGPENPDNEVDRIYLINKGKEPWALKHDESVPPNHRWPSESIAPAGAVFYRGDAFPAWRDRLFVATRNGPALYCVTAFLGNPAFATLITDVSVVLHKELGPLRAVAVGPDGLLYLATANGENDRILRLVPEE